MHWKFTRPWRFSDQVVAAKRWDALQDFESGCVDVKGHGVPRIESLLSSGDGGIVVWGVSSAELLPDGGIGATLSGLPLEWAACAADTVLPGELEMVGLRLQGSSALAIPGNRIDLEHEGALLTIGVSVSQVRHQGCGMTAFIVTSRKVLVAE